MWIPDVYHGAPSSVTLFISTGPKLAAFAMAVRLLVNALPALAADWQPMLVILSVASMAIGNLAAIAQTNIKRMLAYSTISHMGFMLLGLLSGIVGGNTLSAAEAWSAAMFYALVYVLMSLGAFGMVVLLSRAGFEAERLEDFKGLNTRSPWLAFVMLLLMFSLAGIPPTVGFYAKLAVLQAVLGAGQVWLAVVAVLFAWSAPSTTSASSSGCTSTSPRKKRDRDEARRRHPSLCERAGDARARHPAAAADAAVPAGDEVLLRGGA